MTQETIEERVPLGSWLASHLRLTAFRSPAPEVHGIASWGELVGAEPDSTTLMGKLGVKQEEGSYDGWRLVMRTDPTRIDWILAGLDQAAEGLPELPGLCPLTEGLDAFRTLMVKWLDSNPDITRLAFGAKLDYPVEDREAGYRKLSAYLHSVNLDPIGSSDFVYRINRPRDSATGIDGLRINRLSRWGASLRRRGQLSLEQGTARLHETEALVTCGVELDISTVPEFDQDLSKEQWTDVFHELVALAEEILREGDIP